MFQDPIFYYAVAYVLFLLLALKFGRKPGLQWIDGEIAKIRHELDQAKKLRAEAEESLKAAKTKRMEAKVNAEAMIRHAKEEASSLRAAAEANLKDILAKHEQHTLERIRQLEEEAVAGVRAAIVHEAMLAVRKALESHASDANVSRLTDQAIADMPRLEADKARAA